MGSRLSVGTGIGTGTGTVTDRGCGHPRAGLDSCPRTVRALVLLLLSHLSFSIVRRHTHLFAHAHAHSHSHSLARTLSTYFDIRIRNRQSIWSLIYVWLLPSVIDED